ncbi:MULTISPECIES: Pycsar system effector family protein [unclassified Sinorhizobium]|uniref:Pycsar system effector family protein n=1 Tax=unclassified Sinorhizobium TaxID=2613772 RepID=UPI003524D4E2
MSEFENYSELLNSYPSTEYVSSEYFDHIKKINDIFYDQIKISDQKAAYIFTFMLAFLVTSSEGREVFAWARYAQGTPQGILFSAGLAIGSIVSILSAILVVLPRHLNSSTSLFWGAWPKHRDSFREAAARRDEAYLFDQYMENANILSTIARGKYRFVTYAFRGLLVTVIAYVLLLVTV